MERCFNGAPCRTKGDYIDFAKVGFLIDADWLELVAYQNEADGILANQSETSIFKIL